jgi:tRNA threonylcarbamoyladenosine modification (KEOPS) complex  Pcc1 subunit
MKKKITSLLTAAVMLLSLFIIPPGVALAADGTTWDGNAYEFTEELGTEADPYIIDTAGKLAYLAARVNAGDGVYTGSYYSLTEDLDLSGYDWEPIGNGSFVGATFQGYFDGNGHKITGMNVDITSGSFAGLFGATSGATIKNLSVFGNVKVVNSSAGWAISGGIVGSAENGSKIINCCHSGTVEARTNKSDIGASRSGGIAGSNNSSYIINCYHWGNVTAYNPTGPTNNKKPNAGGVIGYIEYGGTAEYCYWDSECTITPVNTYGIGSATSAVSDVEAFTDTDDLLANLNANLEELKDETLYMWEAGSDEYPTFASEKWDDGTPAVSSDATLSALTISAGTLSPAFASGTTSYTANAANSVSSVDITATVNQADASLTINGSPAVSSTASTVDLNVGENTITILVTAQDESTTQTYRLTITRAAAADGSIDPAAAAFDKYTESDDYADVTVTKFDGDYTLSGINNDGDVLILDEDYSIDVDTVTIKKEYLASLAAGTVVLTFDYSDGTDPELTITITDSTPAVSSDAALSALTISAGTLTPDFASGTTSYTASVANSVSSADVTATVNQADATLTINDSAAVSSTASTVDLNVGENIITILVTAQDGSTTRTYALTITRKAASSKGGGSGGSSPTYYSVSVDTEAEHGEVTFDKTRVTAGSKATITVTPDEGYEIDRLLILDKNGKEISYTDNEDGTHSITMPYGDITVDAKFKEIPVVSSEEPQPLPFVDVQESDWYYNAVAYVYGNQLFAGIDEANFAPDTPMSRAMLVTVLWRLEDQKDVNAEQIFSDVLPGTYYAKAVSWANSQEIVQGYGNETFGPQDNITREQMARILYKYAQYKGYDTSAAASLDAFHDASRVSPWALDAVKWAAASQILSGKGSGLLDPSGTATRAEAASILMRLINLEG